MSDREIQSSLRRIRGISLSDQWECIRKIYEGLRDSLFQANLLYSKENSEGEFIGHLASLEETHRIETVSLVPHCEKRRSGYVRDSRHLSELIKFESATAENITCPTCLKEYLYQV